MERQRASEPEIGAIGTRLRAVRARLGWNREALAFHSGLSWSAIAQIESGRRRNVRPDTLSALAGALGVSIDYLVGGRRSPSPMFEHRALLYDSDEEFVETAGPFLAAGIELGQATLAVTSKANIGLLREHLGSGAGTAEFVEAGSWYGAPGSSLNGYRTFSNRVLDQGSPWVRILGEPVWEGRSDAEVRSWTRYESLLNLVFAGSPVTLVCPYDRRSVDAEIVRDAQLTHPHTDGPDGVASSSAYADPAAFVLEWR